MPKRSSKRRPTDLNKLAKSIVEDAVTEDKSPIGDGSSAEPTSSDDDRNPAAVALGRLGGLKGGAARAKKLSKKRRAAIAKKAAEARWSKQKRE